MDPVVVRRNDLFDRRAEARRARRIAAWITIIGNGVLLPAVLIWQGGWLGLGFFALLCIFGATWVWIEGAWSRLHMRGRLQAAAAKGDVDANGKRPKIDAWLLVNDSVGVGIHAASQSLYLFTGKERPERLNVRELRRIYAQRKRGWSGGWRSVLFISDVLAGPGLELAVREGDLRGFLDLVSRGSPHHGLDPVTLAASA